MEKECYSQGHCKLCGCDTPHLQMANKPCEKPCYPRMMSKSKWKDFLKGYSFTDEYGIWENRNDPEDPLEEVTMIKFKRKKTNVVH